MSILVCGATGNVGRGLVELLAGKNTQVRALVRQPPRVEFPADVGVVTADFADWRSLAEAMNGVDRVFVAAPVEKLHFFSRACANAAAAASVKRIVMLSSLSAEDPDTEHAHIHVQAEEAVRQSGCAWTVLRCGQFMSNTLRWAHMIRTEGKVRSYTTDKPVALVDPADLSAAAAAVLLDEGHDEKVLGLTGGELIRSSACARILSQVLGVPIEYVELSDAEAEEIYVAIKGDTPDNRSKLRSLRRSGAPWEAVRPDLADFLGRPPSTYREWAQRNASAFR